MGAHAPVPSRMASSGIKEANWKVLMQIIKENLNDMGCIVVQQMIETRPGEKRGETIKYAAKVVEERRRKQQAQHEKEDPERMKTRTTGRTGEPRTWWTLYGGNTPLLFIFFFKHHMCQDAFLLGTEQT